MEYYNRIKQFFSSARGRDVLIYLLFVVVSFAFWIVLTLGNSIQNHYKVKIQIVGLPENTTIISDYPETMDVSVKNSGYAFVKYMIGDAPTVSINFMDYADGQGRLIVSKQALDELLRGVFGNDASIETFTPEQLQLRYTNLPGRRVPVKIDGDFVADIQYVINGAISVSPDSVSVYSTAENMSLIQDVRTEKISYHNLKDTLHLRVALKNMTDVKMMPDSVNVTVPVEPLVSKRQEIQIVSRNCPADERLVCFPATVDVGYLLPLSMYNVSSQEMQPVVYVDYNDIKGGTNYLPLRIGDGPEVLHNVVLHSDSVEYLIESRK